MFTGIIEEVGIVKGFVKHSNGADITVECKKVLDGTSIGDSIAINGCCQTVVNLNDTVFTANVSRETLNITNFLSLKIGDFVNLERALTPSSRLGGHIVQGHVDGRAKFIKSEKFNDFYNMYFEVAERDAKYIVYKGSVAVDGVSLTVAEINANVFKAAVIPHTFENTAFKYIKQGDFVNIETDILGRYIEKFLYVNNNSSNIDEKFLMENGFI